MITLLDDKPTFVGNRRLIDFDGEEIPIKPGDILSFHDSGTGKGRGRWTVDAVDYEGVRLRSGSTLLTVYNGQKIQPLLF